MPDVCAACGSAPLVGHLRVRRAGGTPSLKPTTDAYGEALADLVRCPRCGHVQVAPMPAAAVLDDLYAGEADGDLLAEQTGQRATAAAVLAAVERHVAPGAVADLGCWLGFLLAEARGRGWPTTVGVEPSAWAAAWAREHLGLDVRDGAVLDADLEHGAFDAVVLGDVLEHLPDPGAALARIRGWLRPGGVVVLMVPDAGSRTARLLGARWWSVLPTHVQYFSRASLGRLLARQGFAVVEQRTAPKAFSLGYYLGRFGGYSRPLGDALVAGATRLGVADRLVAPDLRDRMLVIARSTATAASSARNGSAGVR